MDKDKEYSKLMSLDFDGTATAAAIEQVGRLIDLSGELKRLDGVQRGIHVTESLLCRDLSNFHEAGLEYFLANAWAWTRKINRSGNKTDWDWNQVELSNEILHLRKALRNVEFKQFPVYRRSQVLTNMGNLLDTIGRFSESIEFYDEALETTPFFPMALGNKGVALIFYANNSYDNNHKIVLYKIAYINLVNALQKSDHIHEEVLKHFIYFKEGIENLIKKEDLIKPLKLNDVCFWLTDKENAYRQWCLHNKLFLHPINDVGAYLRAAHDCLLAPKMLCNIEDGPVYQGILNQIKQEYVSSRYIFYESLDFDDSHFSDNGVVLINTLDYTVHSISIEKMKVSYRMAYSIFDKIAFFINKYFNLNDKGKIYFSNIWYNKLERKKGNKDCFISRDNWPLRGLYWLSRDLCETEEFTDYLDPDAKELRDIRNCLEHNYIKIVEMQEPNPEDLNLFRDKIAYKITTQELFAKTLRLHKLVKSAIIYLIYSVHVEEKRKEKELQGEKIGTIKLDKYRMN